MAFDICTKVDNIPEAATLKPQNALTTSFLGIHEKADTAGSAETSGTANTLTTARKINGTDFNGSADITTSK